MGRAGLWSSEFLLKFTLEAPWYLLASCTAGGRAVEKGAADVGCSSAAAGSGYACATTEGALVLLSMRFFSAKCWLSDQRDN